MRLVPRCLPRSLGALALLALAACGGGGGGGGGDPHYYYHFVCNGDSQCLTLNPLPSGTPSGTLDQGPGNPGQINCNSLLTFGNHNWNIPPAQQWCDTASDFSGSPYPAVTISVSPTSVVQDQAATLTWSSSKATSCAANTAWTGARALSGTLVVSQANTGTYSYRLNCSNSNGNATATATLTVTAAPPGVSLSVSPSTITLGQQATLSWSSHQYSACMASGPWSGSKAVNGSEIVTPAAAGHFTYTLGCQGPLKGSGSASVTLTVNPVSGSPPAAPTVALSASTPYPSCMDTGQQNTLTWSSTNATACTASGSWTGDVATSGSQDVYPGAAAGGSNSIYEYVLNCSGPGGSASASAKICAVPTNGGAPPPVTLSFAASPPSIALGESATLQWISHFASSCSAADDWSGIQSLSGTKGVTPSTTGAHIFTLGCQNYQTSAQVTITLSVGPAPGSVPLAARFYQPYGLVEDGANNLYIADTGNHTIRKITAAGQVTTVAGLAGNQGYVNAVGAAARFFFPFAVGIGTSGQVLVSDTGNKTIRLVAPDATVSTLAGDPSNLTDGTHYEGTGSSAFFYSPTALVSDVAGNVYVADTGDCVLRKITPAGVTSTVAGQFRVCGATNGTGSAATFGSLNGLVRIGTDLYVTDTSNNLIRKIDSGGTVTTFAGSGTAASTDGTGTGASFNQPYGIAADSQGNLIVSDQAGHKVRKVTPGGVVTTLAGSGANAAADGTGSGASFSNIYGVAIDSADNAYVADVNAIRKITPAGVVTTYAGQWDAPGSNN